MGEHWDTAKSAVAAGIVGAVATPIAVWVYNTYLIPYLTGTGATAVNLQVGGSITLGFTIGVIAQLIVRYTHIS